MTGSKEHCGFSGGRRRLAGLALGLVAALVAGVIVSPAASAQTFKSLYSFTGGTDEGFPDGPFAQDAKGNLYGVTTFSQNGIGPGTVFRLDQAGKLKVLHAFGGGGNDDGANGLSGVIRDAVGDLYGTTQFGGFDNQGVVFKVSGTGKESVLYRFAGGQDGIGPTAGLVRDAPGNLYGTTSGSALCLECGTVFKVSPAGKQTVLYRFKGPPDASHVLTGNLVLDASGSLYGVSYYGGLKSGCAVTTFGCGTFFKLSPKGKGWSESALYRFKGGSDGAYPYSGLIKDSAGNFYGATEWGGNDGCSGLGCGTLFKIDSTGKETVLYRFTGGSDGDSPGQQIALDAEGNLYGTANSGGNPACQDGGCGTVFKLDTSGKLTVLHAFDGKDGAYPGTLLLDSAGHLYGATWQGGAYGAGTVFEITP
jgi:uncharacterized repeat protein (TIGR03803 family)